MAGLGVAMLLVLAVGRVATARAGQIVYPSHGGIWVMHDDGSAKHELVDVTQVPSMEYLGDPSVQPGGTEVAFEGRWDRASYEQNEFGNAPGFCGGNCEGVYELVAGTVTRITGAPFDCGAQPCASDEFDPRVATDGAVSYVYQTTVSEANGYGGWNPILGESGLFSRDRTGANQQRWLTACEGTAAGGHQVTDADILAVNPTNPGQIIYGNCAEAGGDPNCFGIPFTSGYDVYDSGSARSSASDDVLLHTATDPSAGCFGDGDANTKIGDLDYSPDGSHVVELHGGTGAGIYTYPATAGGGASASELTAIPAGWTIWSVRYLGADRIGFSAGPSNDKIAIYSIPTSCTPATCDASSGAGVTNLTGSGDVSNDYVMNTAEFGYTSSDAPITVASTGGSGGSGGSGGTGDTGGSGGSKGGGAAPSARVSHIGAQHLKILLSKGLRFTISCSANCRVAASITLKRKVVGKLTKTLKQGHRVKLRIRIAHRSRGALRHTRARKLSLKLVISNGTGQKRTRTIGFAVRR